MKNKFFILLITIGFFSAIIGNNCYAAFQINVKSNTITTLLVGAEQNNIKQTFGNLGFLHPKEYFGKKHKALNFLQKEKLGKKEASGIDGKVILSWISIGLSLIAYSLMFFDATLVAGICVAIANGIFTWIAVDVKKMDANKVYGYIALILIFPIWCIEWLALNWWWIY